MKFTELIVLLPCHGLDDFPTNLRDDDAEGLLAGWSALWHPVLLAAAGSMPTWRAAEFPSDSLTGKLIVVPPVVEKVFSGDLDSRAASDGGRIIHGLHRREELVEALLRALASGEDEAAAALVAKQAASAAAVAPDFLALGTCVLFSELLVRRMRYSSNLLETTFQPNLLAAATAAISGDADEARRNLTLCCNTLVESRGRYYPVDMSVVDLTLVAATTIGEPLRQELTGNRPVNLLMTAEVLDEIARQEPVTLAALRGAMDRGTAVVLGGELGEPELPLMSLESIAAELRAGLAVYETHLGRRPAVFARRRFGLTPGLPPILASLGFRAALHATLDDGRFPQADGGKIRWEGLDNTTLDALARAPLDASQPGSFIALAEKVGHAMDHDHVATVSFAHWPGQVSPFYDDLRRIAAIAPTIGKFVTLEQFFTNTDSSGVYSKFLPDEYRSPYLQQDVATGVIDPLSRWVRRAQDEVMTQSGESLEALAAMLCGTSSADANAGSPSPFQGEGEGSELAAEYSATRVASGAAKAFAAAMPRENREPVRGYLVANPCGFGRRMLVDVSDLAELPPVKAPLKAVETYPGGKRAIVDLPPFGFAWIGPIGGAAGKNWDDKPVADGQTLRNEFCEVSIHPTTGGIQSIHDFRRRGNRLSQQLIYRMPPAPGETADAESVPSRMVADSIKVTSSGLLAGEITSRGKLIDAAGQQLAAFTQRVQLAVGSRIVGLEIEIDSTEPLAADPWNSYIACRYAWPDRGAELRRSVHLESHLTRAKRIEAPHFIEIDAIEGRTAFLSGGLPYHQRIGSRMLDTLLAVRGETAKAMRLGIGIDAPHAWMAALDFMAPQIVHRETAAPPTPSSYGWLFILDAKNIAVTHCSPLVAEGESPTAVVGARFRLLETEGRGGRVMLRCFHAPKSAARMDFNGNATAVLTVDDDRVVVDFGSYEWVQVEVRWA